MDDIKRANRQYKDRLFKVIFGSPERKEYALSLYNAVNGSHYPDADLLDFYTIENAVYMGMKNDLSFLFDATLNLYEQQSSFNPNMPLRGLMYLSKQYEKYVKDNNLNLYRSTLCKVPAPRYIVFYNGNDIQPDRKELKLSDAYITSIKDAALEVNAVMLNINYGQNKKIMKACTPLNDYSKFVSYVKMNQRKGLAVKEAVNAAVEKAIEENLLDGFFAEHRAEVIGMILTEYDEEFVHKGWFEDGMIKGRQEERYNIIKSMLASGMTPEKISDCTKIPLETILDFEE